MPAVEAKPEIDEDTWLTMINNHAPSGTERVCVLILGMHRSGTSAVARLVSLIGAGLPRHLMNASGSNVAGHWEPKLLVQLNDRMLLEGGSAWNDWRPFNPEVALLPKAFEYFRDEIRRKLDEEFAGQRLFVLKDPRIARFAPFYLQLLESLGITVKVVLILRHPMEVAGSLDKRDEMPLSDALLLWLRHNIDAEAATRGVDRLVLSYDALMKDPADAIRRLQRLLASSAPPGSAFDLAAAQASVRSELRHHDAGPLECAALPEAASWAAESVAAFEALEREEAPAAAYSALDSVHTSIDRDAILHGERIVYFLAAARRAQFEIQDLIRQRDYGLDYQDHKYRDIADRYRDLDDEFERYRRDRIAQLALTKRLDFEAPNEVPVELSPWRSLRRAKRKRVRQRLQDYLTLLASPLFDSGFYLRQYPDVGRAGFLPALHYLLHGSDEKRQPSAIVNPDEVLKWFPELNGLQGNLLLNLIDLQARAKGERASASTDDKVTAPGSTQNKLG